jgi:hypothetical protein
MPKMPEMMLGALYAHELYHGLQDQYFDLNRYLLNPARHDSLDEDQMLARRAIVEGEATYMMTLWLVKHATGSMPSRELLANAVQQQSKMDLETMRAAFKQPQIAELMGEDVKAVFDAIDSIPPFMFDSLIGAYLSGLGFVFAVDERGWSEVEKLYRDRPPISTEQILHPEKWFAGEAPTRISWPAFSDRSLRDWDLLEDDVLGEFRLRSVFKAQGLKAEANTLAAGWDGDRYAVLKHKKSGELLLMLYTAWDTEADAAKFVDGYRRALATKYAGVDEPTRVIQKGKGVLIVEGGGATKIDSIVAFVGKAKRAKAQ